MTLTNLVIIGCDLLRHLDREMPRTIHSFVIADTTRSFPFVEHAAQHLRRAGLITSIRGPGGGYTVSEKRISLHDVCTAMKSYKAKPGQIAGKLDEALQGITVVEAHEPTV